MSINCKFNLPHSPRVACNKFSKLILSPTFNQFKCQKSTIALACFKLTILFFIFIFVVFSFFVINLRLEACPQNAELQSELELVWESRGNPLEQQMIPHGKLLDVLDHWETRNAALIRCRESYSYFVCLLLLSI